MYQQSSWYDLQFLTYRMWQTEIVNYGSFFALLPSPLKTKKKKSESWKNEKNCSRYHHFSKVYQKPKSYEVQFLRYAVRQTGFFVILGHFLPFYSHNNQENQNSTKMKKVTGDGIILHMCTKNHNHMMYSSWDMEYDRQLFVILGHFLPFYPTIDPKNKNLK